MPRNNDIQENLKCGIIEILILSLLYEEDMYGYQLKNEMEDRSGGTFLVKQGSLYVPLYRMEQQGKISSYKEQAGERRVRVYYHIEEAGKEYLRHATREFRRIFDGANNIIKGCKINDETTESSS